MTRRVAFGTVTILVILAMATLDAAIAQWADHRESALGELLARGSIIPVVMTVLFVMGAFELNHLLQLKGLRPHARFAYLMVATLMLAPWLSAAGWLGAGAAEVEGLYWQVVFLVAAAVGTGILTVIRAQPANSIRDSSATLMIIVFLGFLGSFGVHMRCACDTPEQQGAWLLLIVVLVTKASDIGAFLVGSVAGRKKLLPAISPGKTVEGTLGGLMGSAAVAVLVVSAGSLANGMTSLEFASGPIETGARALALLEAATQSFTMVRTESDMSPVLRAFVFGLAMSAAGQFGDLIESCFKRDAGVKDSSNVIRPFGGILDVIDSLIPAIPLAWFLLTRVWNVV